MINFPRVLRDVSGSMSMSSYEITLHLAAGRSDLHLLKFNCYILYEENGSIGLQTEQLLQ